MSVSLLNVMLADDVERLLDNEMLRQDPDDDRRFSRDQARAIIHAALWAYSARADSMAAAYAFLSLMEAIGIKGWAFEDDEVDALADYRVKKWRETAALPAPHGKE